MRFGCEHRAGIVNAFGNGEEPGDGCDGDASRICSLDVWVGA